MTTKLSIRELTRSGSILLDYDYIEIEDRKSHQYKGVFVPDRYADAVKDFLDKKILAEKNAKKKDLFRFAGIADQETGDKKIQELIAEKGKKYE